jgi:hypothetical protein
MERTINIYDYICKYKLDDIKKCIPIIYVRSEYLTNEEYSSYILKLSQRINEDIPKDIILTLDVIDFYIENIVGNILSIHIKMLLSNYKPNYNDLYISKVLSEHYKKGDNYSLSVIHWIKLFKGMITYQTCPTLIMESERSLVDNEYIIKIIREYMGERKLKYIRYVDTLLNIRNNDELIMTNIINTSLFDIIRLINRYNIKI